MPRVTDAPASPCGACATPTKSLCAYAPGCATAARFCAPDTCLDAVAIEYCGCEGATFVSGCIFPDRPYRHAGPCQPADGGGETSYTVTDGGTMCVDLGMFRRGCMCTGGGMSTPIVACGASETGSCHAYMNGCPEAETIPCTLLAYRNHPGLRERCVAFCASLREREPGAACSIDTL